MNRIKNINNINDLAEYDKIIREHALILTKTNDKNLADELVQEMYLNLDKYLAKYPNKVIDGGFVSVSIRNILRNYQKYELNRYNFGGETYEAVIPDSIDDYEEILREKIQLEKKYEIMEDRINNLQWYEKKVLDYSKTMSLLELSKKSKISYQSLITTRDKIHNKLGIIK